MSIFELTDDRVRQIIFAMENQTVPYVVDMEEGKVLREEDLEPEERPSGRDVYDPEQRYQPVPAWESADGFQLMERFVSELHNPLVSGELQSILSSGKRVFRRFKDHLHGYPTLERKWHSFKFLAMRAEILEWYNTLRELAGMEALELGADEEVDAIVGSEFSIDLLTGAGNADMREFDQRAFSEAFEGLLPPLLYNVLWAQRERSLPDPLSESSVCLGAHTPMGELAGFVWYVEVHDGADEKPRPGDQPAPIWSVEQIYVLPEYRSLGIATLLLTDVLDAAARGGVSYLCAGIGLKCEALGSLLERNGFRTVGGMSFRPVGG